MMRILLLVCFFAVCTSDSFTQKVSISKDLIVGSEQMPAMGQMINDSIMFFNVNKSAFRAGSISTSGAFWSPENIGYYSFAANRNTIASGYYSTAFGNRTVASGTRSFAIGYFSEALGSYSFASGERTEAIGNRSASFGRYTLADSYASMVTGRYNVGGGNATSWLDSDPLFEIGNGTSSINRSNALTVLKNGNTGVGTATPSDKLTVAGDVNVTGEIKANGVSGQNMQLLSSDGNGGMNWIDMNEYKNFFDVTSTTSTTWTVPAGVDKICVELWGAGGGGAAGGGGGAGGYLKAVVNVTENMMLTLDVGAGGDGVSGGELVNAENGEFSQCSGTGINLLALGGTGGKTTVPGTGGAFAFTVPESYIRLKGENGKPLRNRQVQISSTVFDIETTFGDGGSPPFFPRNGGQGEVWQKSNTGFLFQNNGTDGLQPGGGGGGGNVHNQSGGDGYIIIRW